MAAKIAATGAMALLISEAFVATPVTKLCAQRSAAQPAAEKTASAAAGSSSAPLAAMTLAAGSVAAVAAASRRKTRTAVCSVITTDDKGRSRFAVAGGAPAAAVAAVAAVGPAGVVAMAAGGAPHVQAATGAAVRNDTPYVKRYWPTYPVEVKGEISSQMGATLPMSTLGGYWDPLGMAADGDLVAFRRRREAEIKNGRVAMIACIGYIVPEYFRLPGFCSPSNDLKFTDIPNGVAALYKIPAEGWAQIGCFVAFLELFPMRQDLERPAGDFKTCGKLGVPWFFVAGRAGTDSDQEKNGRSLDAEINNGRLAMVAITGMVWQNAFLGTSGPEMWFPSS